MPFCSKCGFKADEDDAFCARCGTRLKELLAGDLGAQDQENFVDWKSGKKEVSLWNSVKRNVRHIFFDNENRMPAKRKIVNSILAILIISMAVWIATPWLENVKISIGNGGAIEDNGQCRYRLDERDISVTNALFLKDELEMELLVTNSLSEDVVLEGIAKTYEFRFDNQGDTEIDERTLLIPAGTTANVSFSVRQEPYILGLDFSGCKKKKVSEWKVATS